MEKLIHFALIISFILPGGLLLQGCSESNKDRHSASHFQSGDTTTSTQNNTSGQIPAKLIPVAATSSSPLEIEQGATFQFSAKVVINGQEVVPDKNQLKWELMDANLGSITVGGLFSATQSAELTGGLKVTYTHADNTTHVTEFPGVIKVVVVTSTASPPVEITINPTMQTFGFNQSKTFQVFVKKQNGVTIELDENQDAGIYDTSVSNTGVCQVDKLTVTSLATEGTSDFTIGVTLAGVRLQQVFSAIEVKNPAPQNPGTTFHGFPLPAADLKVKTEELSAAGGTPNGNDGLVAWGEVTAVSGNNVTVKITVQYGTFHGEDNSNFTDGQTYLLPGYKNGAEVNRPPADYTAIELKEVPGSRGLLREAITAKFPKNGTYSLTFTLSGTSFADYTYMRGLPFDSSYNPTRANLEFHYDETLNQVIVGKRP